jgi:hypothetical protein
MVIAQHHNHATHHLFSAVVFDDKAVSTATNQDLACVISGLSEDTPITWVDPDNNEISDSDIENYVVEQGVFFLENKASTLTIKTKKFASLSSGDIFKCKVKSAKYPVDSPEVVKEMTLTLLTLGNTENSSVQ